MEGGRVTDGWSAGLMAGEGEGGGSREREGEVGRVTDGWSAGSMAGEGEGGAGGRGM